jgi:hypothetical protein
MKSDPMKIELADTGVGLDWGWKPIIYDPNIESST